MKENRIIGITISLFIILMLSGCALYIYEFHPINEFKVGKYSFGASISPSVIDGNYEKKMKNRKYDLYISVSQNINEMNAVQLRMDQGAIDSCFMVDTIIITFKGNKESKSIKVSEYSALPIISKRRKIMFKQYVKRELIIPDTIQNIQMIVPYYSILPDSINYDTLVFDLRRQFRKQDYTFVP